jgi:hypothetical protein
VTTELVDDRTYYDLDPMLRTKKRSESVVKTHLIATYLSSVWGPLLHAEPCTSIEPIPQEAKERPPEN